MHSEDDYVPSAPQHSIRGVRAQNRLSKASFSLLALLPTIISFAAAASACEKAAQWQFAVLLLANAWEKAVDVDVPLP